MTIYTLYIQGLHCSVQPQNRTICSLEYIVLGYIHSYLNCICCITVHCTNYTPQTVYCTLYIVHSTLYSTHCTLHSTNCILYNTHCTLYSTHCTLYSAHYTLYSVQCTVYSEKAIYIHIQRIYTGGTIELVSPRTGSFIVTVAIVTTNSTQLDTSRNIPLLSAVVVNGCAHL